MSNVDSSSTAKTLSPYILIQPYKFTLTIGKDVIKCLGFPTHISLRINEQNNSFALIPCEEKNVMSFKVPERLLTDHHSVFRITSKSFVMTLLLKYGLSPKNIYECRGIYSEKVNAVIVSLDKDNLKERDIRCVMKTGT